MVVQVGIISTPRPSSYARPPDTILSLSLTPKNVSQVHVPLVFSRNRPQLNSTQLNKPIVLSCTAILPLRCKSIHPIHLPVSKPAVHYPTNSQSTISDIRTGRIIYARYVLSELSPYLTATTGLTAGASFSFPFRCSLFLFLFLFLFLDSFKKNTTIELNCREYFRSVIFPRV